MEFEKATKQKRIEIEKIAQLSIYIYEPEKRKSKRLKTQGGDDGG